VLIAVFTLTLITTAMKFRTALSTAGSAIMKQARVLAHRQAQSQLMYDNSPGFV